MGEVGLPVDYIDTQDVTITNSTDSLTYKQATNVRAYIKADLTRRQRTDSVFENLWDLRYSAYEVDVMVTQPEIAALVALTLQTNNQLPIKSWAIAMKDEGGTTTTITGNAQLATFEFIDVGIGAMKYNMRLEFADTTIGVV